MPNSDGSETYLEQALRRSIEHVRIQNEILARQKPAPLSPHNQHLGRQHSFGTQPSMVREAVTEARALEERVNTRGAVVERVVVTRAQLMEHLADGYKALFRWEQEQKALGREVFFHDDVVGERVVFEARDPA